MNANNPEYRFKTATENDMLKRGIHAVSLRAEDFYNSLPEDNSTVIRWESIGNVNGVECFVTRRIRRAIDGRSVEILSVAPDNEGNIYPVMNYYLNSGLRIRTFRKANGEAA